MAVHIDELHSDVAATSAPVSARPVAAKSAAEVLGQDVARWRDLRARAESLQTRLAAEDFDD